MKSRFFIRALQIKASGITYFSKIFHLTGSRGILNKPRRIKKTPAGVHIRYFRVKISVYFIPVNLIIFDDSVASEE